MTISPIKQSMTIAVQAQVSQSSTASDVRSAWWNHIWERFAAILLDRQEPIVKKQRDAQGFYWQIDDPASNRRVIVRSQQEASVWLEQRHLQTPKFP